MEVSSALIAGTDFSPILGVSGATAQVKQTLENMCMQATIGGQGPDLTKSGQEADTAMQGSSFQLFVLVPSQFLF